VGFVLTSKAYTELVERNSWPQGSLVYRWTTC